MAMRGKWAQGITPRHFTWVLQDKLAICERPGGYGVNHRKVRRQEEIIWIREQHFTTVFSVIASPHNLHNYDELGVAWRHRPFTVHDDTETYLRRVYPEWRDLIAGGGKLLVHGDEVSDRLCGLVAGYVLWSVDHVPAGPQAISIVEQLLKRQLGPTAREIVAIASSLPHPSQLAAPAIPTQQAPAEESADAE